jgi:hypothetical protein
VCVCVNIVYVRRPFELCVKRAEVAGEAVAGVWLTGPVVAVARSRTDVREA